jgi:hypothetical protein
MSSLPEEDQSIPHLAVESVLYSRGCNLEIIMISPLSVGRFSCVSSWITATDNTPCILQCNGFFAFYSF